MGAFSWQFITLSCGMHAGSNPGPLHWEHGVLPTGPPGKSLFFLFWFFFFFFLVPDIMHANISESVVVS